MICPGFMHAANKGTELIAPAVAVRYFAVVQMPRWSTVIGPSAEIPRSAIGRFERGKRFWRADAEALHVCGMIKSTYSF